MKKFLLSLVCILAGITAWAQDPLYITGDFAASNWAPAAPAVMTYDAASGTYSYKAEMQQFKISKAKGDWVTFNAHAIGTGATVTNGATVSIAAWGENTMLDYKGDWTITVDLNAMTLKATTTTSKPTGYTKVYIRGDMTGATWPALPEWEMSTTDGISYSIENVTIPAGKGFKIADANWGKINYGGVAKMEPNKDYTLTYNSSTDCTMKASFTGNVKFNVNTKVVRFEAGGDIETDATVYFDNTDTAWDVVYAYCTKADGSALEAMPGEEMDAYKANLFKYVVPAGYATVRFNNGEGTTSVPFQVKDNTVYTLDSFEPFVEPVDYSGYYINVVGEFNNWGDNGVKANADGEATVVVEDATGPFKIKVWNGTENEYYSNGQTIVLDTPTLVDSDNSANMTFPTASTANFAVTYSCKTHMLTIKENVVDISKFWVNFAGDWNNWLPDGVRIVDGVATQEQAIPADATALNFKVKIYDEVSGTDAFYSNGAEIALNTPTVIKGNGEVMTLPESVKGWTVKFDFDYATKTLTVTKTTGIDGVEADDEVAPVYYNLQGVRVDEPANGLYIVVRGNKVAKEIVK